MRKTPSYLKGLAETRARAAADVRRYQQLISEIMVSMTKAQVELESCDVLIRKFDERLDPNSIQPVNHWQGKYGKRGGLKTAVLDVLKERSPAAVTTTEVGWQIQRQFEITFCHPKEREAWMTNSIGNCLKRLANEGLVEPCHDRSNTGLVGTWRLK